MRTAHPVLTLTTDFGTKDAYVAAMKGVILGIAPAVRLVDITHAITAQDVMEAAFILRQAIPYFPAGTVHAVVVDPGVGTSRRPIAAQYGRHTFVGPDNGLFPLAMDDEPDEAVVLDVPAFWRVPEPSATFHGRDIFAPVAAHLCAGIPLTDLGSPAGALRTLRWAQPVVTPTGMQGRVVHVDRFGNCITNIEGSLFDDARGRRSTKTYVGTAIVRGRHRTYADVPEGEALILTGSSGLVEIAINGGNAAGLFSVRKGDAVNVMFLEQPDVIR